MLRTFCRSGSSFLAEVSGADFTRPIDTSTLQQINDAMARHGVCVFRGTALNDESHLAFSRLFGELEQAPKLFGGARTRFRHPELFDAGNLDADGKILEDQRRRTYNKGNALW